MIPRKKKVCTECGQEQYIFSKGRCQMCATRTYKQPKKTRSKAKTLKSETLTPFFDKAILKAAENPFCAETGEFISDLSRWNISHILPKSRYESIMTNELNYMLYSREAHTEFDHYLDRMDFEGLEKHFPNSWGKVCLKVKELLPLTLEGGNLKDKFEEYLKDK